MNWIGEVAASEFVWGIVVGIALSTLSVLFANWVTTQRNQKAYLSFIRDIGRNITDHASEMQKGVSDSKIIQIEHVVRIDDELGIYGRNREHIISVRSEELRKKIRLFLNRVAVLNTRIRLGLDDFYGPGEQGFRNNRLAHAQATCTELKAHCDGDGASLQSAIEAQLKQIPARHIV